MTQKRNAILLFTFIAHISTLKNTKRILNMWKNSKKLRFLDQSAGAAITSTRNVIPFLTFTAQNITLQD